MRTFIFSMALLASLAGGRAWGVATGDGPGTVGTTDGQSELELWVKADDLTLADGVAVAEWPDASGNERHLSQPTAAWQPVVVQDALNGRPVVRFSADHFGSLTLPSSGNQFTVVAVVKPTRTGTYHNIVEDDASTRPMLWVDGLGNYEFNYASGAVAPSTGGWDIVMAVKTTSGPQYSRLYVNAPTVAATGSSNFTIAASKVYDLFNRDDAQAFSGDVAELIIYSTALTAAEVNKLGWALQEKYGLTSTFQPPFPTLTRYQTAPATYPVYDPIAPNAPVLAGTTGATVTGFTISPDLPPGLTLDPVTGILSGTPTSLSPPTDYTVTVAFVGHPNSSTVLRLSVTGPSLSGYSVESAVLTRAQAMAPMDPVVVGGQASGFSVSPPLPPGLYLHPQSGVIAGTPATTTPATNYTITATFAGFPPASHPISIEIVEFHDTLDITEFLTSNDTGLTDGNGRQSDWIEIHNFGDSPVNLAGWSLTDNANSLRKWIFPSLALAPGGYLVVFASGEDQPDPTGALHTNFSLSVEGEYLALVQPDGVTVAREFAPAFPPQSVDVSYGTRDRVVFGPFATPTPGAANGFFDVSSRRVTATPAGRAFAGSLAVTLAADLQGGAVIRYTLNGTTPTASSPVYQGPLSLAVTTRLRARVFEPGLEPGPLLGEPYLKLGADVAGFSSNLPLLFLDTDAAIAASASPTLTGTDTILIPPDPSTQRATAQGVPDYARRGGLRIRGRSSQSFPQKQFKFETWDSAGRETNARLLGMGAGSDFVLYAPYTDKSLMRNALAYSMWGNLGWPSLETRFVEVFINDNRSSQVTYADDYAGIYMLVEAITLERMGMARPEAAPTPLTGGFIIETGPSDDQEFSTSGSGRTTGHKFRDPGRERLTPAQRSWAQTAYTTFEQALYGQGFRHPTTSQHYSDLTDVDSQVDYKIVREWSRNFDGGSTYSRIPRGGKLTMGPLWDYNWAFGNVNYAEGGDLPGYRTDGWNRSFTGMVPWAPWWVRFEQDPDWWQQVIDRWASLRDGVLADAAVAAEIDALATALGAEAAGRHFTRWPQLGQFTVISPPGWQTRTTYQSEVDYLKDWLAARSAWIDAQFPTRPVVTPAPGPVPVGTAVTLTAGAGQTIHYTVDGTDPRLAGGAVAAAARTLTSGNNFTLDSSAVVVARTRSGTTWGPPRTTSFVTGPPPPPASLVVTELAFHPADPTASELAALGAVTADDFEFIELRNVGDSTVDLTGAAFTRGIAFTFPPGTELAAGAYLAIVKNPTAFARRHPDAPPVLGPYDGNLANNGETLVLSAAGGAELIRLTYRDSWSVAADGGGYSLVLRDPDRPPNNYNEPAVWTLSGQRHGSPGTANGPLTAREFNLWRAATFSTADLENPARSGAMADPDADGAVTWLEYALGSDPLDGGSLPNVAVSVDSGMVQLSFTRPREVLDAVTMVEASTDGATWSPLSVTFNVTTTSDTTESVVAQWPDPTGSPFLLRLRISRTY